ncbi:MAG: DEAD/DEAH box helicase, partial [Saezia sp.]
MSEAQPKMENNTASGIVDVAVDLPAHSQLGGLLSYHGDIAPGMIVRVPLGKKRVAGISWDSSQHNWAREDSTFELRAVDEVFEELAPLNAHWRELVNFAAGYYQRSLGEVALQALPPDLRKLDRLQLQRRLVRLDNKIKKQSSATQSTTKNQPPLLTSEQDGVLSQICEALTCFSNASHAAVLEEMPAAFLLQGATGSGKTEIYMRATQEALLQDRQAQVLVLVPEINLTPQLEERYRMRFPEESIVTLHSGMTNAQRLQAWLLAHMGKARIILGTRMAIFASLPTLKLIIVDEEHDPSYKQQEGARWSARDLAVWRGKQEQLPVLL